MPFLCLQTAAIPDGIIQITDMSPNESQRSEIQGEGQTRYVNRVQNDTVADSIANAVRTVTNRCQGLAAYIIDNVDAGAVAGGRDDNGKIVNTELKNSGAELRYNAMKLIYAESVTNTIVLSVGIIASLFFIAKNR